MTDDGALKEFSNFQRFEINLQKYSVLGRREPYKGELGGCVGGVGGVGGELFWSFRASVSTGLGVHQQNPPPRVADAICFRVCTEYVQCNLLCRYRRLILKLTLVECSLSRLDLLNDSLPPSPCTLYSVTYYTTLPWR